PSCGSTAQCSASSRPTTSSPSRWRTCTHDSWCGWVVLRPESEEEAVLGFIVLLILSGLIIGALGRLAVPGPNPMSIPMTIAVGIGGSLLGGIVGKLLFGRPGG